MTCPICGKPRKDIVLRRDDGKTSEQWATCEGCKVFFVREMPTPKESLEYYTTGTYRRRVYAARRKLRGLDLNKAYLTEAVNEGMRAMYVLMLMTAYGWTPKRMLDVGAGMGMLSFEAHREWPACEVLAVEPLTEYLIVGGIPNVKTIDEVTETYDTITCIHVLEHLPNPIQFLSNIAKHLEPGGRLFLEVPNYSPKDGNNPFQLSHVFVYTVEGLVNVLERAGLKPLTHMTHGWLFRYGTAVSTFMVAERTNDI